MLFAVKMRMLRFHSQYMWSLDYEGSREGGLMHSTFPFELNSEMLNWYVLKNSKKDKYGE